MLKQGLTADFHCVGISSFAVDESVGWLVQVSLTLFAFTPSASLAVPVTAKSVWLTCTSQPTDSSTAKLEIPTQWKSAAYSFGEQGMQLVQPSKFFSVTISRTRSIGSIGMRVCVDLCYVAIFSNAEKFPMFVQSLW